MMIGLIFFGLIIIGVFIHMTLKEGFILAVAWFATIILVSIVLVFMMDNLTDFMVEMSINNK